MGNLFRSHCAKLVGLLGSVLVIAGGASRGAAAPQIGNLPIRGLQTGATTTLIIEGTDLLPQPKLLLAVPITAQSLKPGATAQRVEIDVTLAATVSPGRYPLRVATSQGISSPVIVHVDDLVQQPFSEKLTRLPAALYGLLPDGQTVHTTFEGKKGQRLVAEVEARRLESAIDPVLELLDPNQVPVAWAQGLVVHDGDARLEATLPADGLYTVQLHDALYQPKSPNRFSLRIGALHTPDLVFPLGGQRGTKPVVEILSPTLPTGLRVPVDLTKATGDVPVHLPPQSGLTGRSPRLRVGEYPEVLESTPPPGKLQEIAVPAAIDGRLGNSGEVDRYRLLVQPGMRLQFDLLANRAGSPVDGKLTLQNDSGAVLAENDDRPDTVDPGLEFTVPDGVKSLVVAIADIQGRGGPFSVYRLSVTPAGAPDFQLDLLADRHQIAAPGVDVLRVRAERRGYNGPISLAFAPLPAGVEVTGNEIPAGATDALVTIRSTAAQSPVQGVFQVVGSSVGVQPPLQRLALLPVTPATRHEPWLRSEVGWAITEPAPLQLAWADASNRLALGTRAELKIHVQRGPAAAGPIRFSLLTSQIIPKTADGQQDDLNRALRIQGPVVIAAGQTDAVVPVLVPGDLPALPYDLAIRAELLSADQQSVVATAVTPSRRFSVGQPFELQLASAASIQAKSGSGSTGKFVGRLIRAGGFDKPVTVTLAGLPPELPAPMIMVPAGKKEFELPVAFPFETKAGLLANVKLVATAQVTPQQVVRSNEVPVSIQVIPGDRPPPPAALYRVFEDEAGFAAALNEGDGQISPELVDRYSGNLALRISGVQRLRAKMPGWDFPINEKPGPGEFRYLRFAWKRQGGSSILLQLNADGKWGPMAGTPGPSYRYEAGPGPNPLQAAAIKVDPHLPSDWVVVTRDLFADFGRFRLTGLALTAGPGGYALFDHLYLARSLDDFKGCPAPIMPEQPRRIFEDEADFVANLLEGAGTANLEPKDKYSGSSSIKVTPDQRFTERLPNLGVRIRENPGPGEYRFLRFAWKKQGGQAICLQLNHEGQWGPTPSQPGKFRYHAGPGPECYGASLNVDSHLPTDWVVVTRDLYADFGEFTWTGIALSPVDGDYALFDHIYLGRTPRDFELAKPKEKK